MLKSFIVLMQFSDLYQQDRCYLTGSLVNLELSPVNFFIIKTYAISDQFIK